MGLQMDFFSFFFSMPVIVHVTPGTPVTPTYLFFKNTPPSISCSIPVWRTVHSCLENCLQTPGSPAETGLDWTVLSRDTVPTIQTTQSRHTSNNCLDHSRTIKRIPQICCIVNCTAYSAIYKQKYELNKAK